MFFTRQYDYALRVIRALANGELLSVKEICDLEHIPQPYAYKILKKLEMASIVESSRGVNGGYKLTKKLRDISLYSIYIALEGALHLNECMVAGYKCPHNDGEESCCIQKELCILQNEFVDKLRSRDLHSVLKKSML